MYGSANRDERQFPRPGHRPRAPQHEDPCRVGRGAHACPGSLLASTEARIALETLLTRLEEIELGTASEALPYVPSYVARGVLGLPLKFTANRAPDRRHRRRVRLTYPTEPSGRSDS